VSGNQALHDHAGLDKAVSLRSERSTGTVGSMEGGGYGCGCVDMAMDMGLQSDLCFCAETEAEAAVKGGALR
jgi:hypothetical protein